MDLSSIYFLAFTKIAIVIGSEQTGVSFDFLDHSQVVIHLPLYGVISSIIIVLGLGIVLHKLRGLD